MEFINIRPAYIRGWVGGVWEWSGWWQKLKQRSKKTQIVEFRQYFITRPRQMYADRGSNIRSPLPKWSPPLAPFYQSWICKVSKKHSGKADQLTLADGGSEHV